MHGIRLPLREQQEGVGGVGGRQVQRSLSHHPISHGGGGPAATASVPAARQLLVVQRVASRPLPQPLEEAALLARALTDIFWNRENHDRRSVPRITIRLASCRIGSTPEIDFHLFKQRGEACGDSRHDVWPQITCQREYAIACIYI